MRKLGAGQLQHLEREVDAAIVRRIEYGGELPGPARDVQHMMTAPQAQLGVDALSELAATSVDEDHVLLVLGGLHPVVPVFRSGWISFRSSWHRCVKVNRSRMRAAPAAAILRRSSGF